MKLFLQNIDDLSFKLNKYKKDKKLEKNSQKRKKNI